MDARQLTAQQMLADNEDNDLPRERYPHHMQSSRHNQELNDTYAEFDEDGNPLPNQTREEYDSEEDSPDK